jgi:hypothetical protein
MVLFSFEMPSMDNSLRPITQKSTYVTSVIICHLASPSLQFYFAMFILYSALAAAWGWLCYKNIAEILPIQVRIIWKLGTFAHGIDYRHG